MRCQERTHGLLRTPLLFWETLALGRYRFVYDRMPMAASRMPLPRRLNLLRSGGNLIHRRLKPWSMPLHMQFELTNYCSLRCPVCPTGSKSMRRPPEAMNAALFERLIEEVGPYLLTASLWAWGEPLLHPELDRILRVARGHDVITLLSTNGQCLDQDRVLEALTASPPDYLIVAFDGLTDETNSRYRVGANLSSILEGVRKLAQRKRERGLQKPVLNMRFIVMKHNRHELGLLDEFARQNGFELLSVRNMFVIDSTCDQATAHCLRPDPEPRDGAHGKFICMEPFWFPTVFADGTVVLCEQDYNAEFALGRVSEGVSFRDLWRSRRAAELRKVIRDTRLDVSFCRKCPYADRPITDFNEEARFLEVG